MKPKSPRTSQALLDVILGMLAVIILLITTQSEGNVQTRADYALEVSWDDAIDVDIDTWVMRPDDVKMSYQNKDTGMVSIDRDDLGNRNDPGKANIEVSSFRAPMDGVYYVSVHNYMTRDTFDPSWEVVVVLRDTRRGNRGVLWSAVILMPPPREEQPVLAFEVRNGNVVRKWKSERHITRWGPE